MISGDGIRGTSGVIQRPGAARPVQQAEWSVAGQCGTLRDIVTKAHKHATR